MKLIDLFEDAGTHIGLVDDPKLAVEYAKKQAAIDHVDDYVIFEVTIPDKTKLVQTHSVWGMKDTGEMDYNGRIPPNFFKVYKEGKV